MNEDWRKKVLSVVTILATLSTIPLLSYYFFEVDRPVEGTIQIFFVILFLSSAFALFLAKKLDLATNIFMFAALTYSAYTVISGGANTEDMTWTLTLIPMAFLLTGRRVGLIWSISYIAFLLIIQILALLNIYTTASSLDILSLTISMVILTGPLYYYVGKIEGQERDAQEQKAKFQGFLASIGEGLLGIDKAGKIIVINEQARILLGMRGKNLLGKDISTIIKAFGKNENNTIPLDKPPLLSVLLTKAQHVETYYYTRSDGKRFPVRSVVTPVVSQQEVIGAVETFIDITKEIEISKAKSEFVSLAANMLKTPLTSLRWKTESLLAGDFDPLTQKQISAISELNQIDMNMIGLIDALLNVSQIELGIFKVSTEPTNLIFLIKDNLNVLKSKIDEKHISVKEDYAPYLPNILLDRNLVSIVIQNLLTNAVRFNKQNGFITISIRIDQNSNEAILTISDSGVGIPLDQQQLIFSKFFRARNIQGQNIEGIGLGLYTAKSILDSTGCKIWFDSTEGQGSNFHVAIPLKGMSDKSSSTTDNLGQAIKAIFQKNV